MKPSNRPRPPREDDRPRWRCSKCEFLHETQLGGICSVCQCGPVRPAPSLAVERAQRAVVRAAMHWHMSLCIEDWRSRLDAAVILLICARAYARTARRMKP